MTDPEGSVRAADAGTRPWRVAGWVGLFGWWLGAYLLTLIDHGWIWTELATLRAGGESFTGMLADRAVFGHCPIYFSLSWTIQQLFGENLIAMRLPSVVLGLGCSLLVYRLVRRWEGEGPALFAALLVVLSPLLLGLSQQARPYTLTIFLGLLATDIMIAPEPTGGGTRARRFGLVTLFGLLSSHSYWFVLAAHVTVFGLRPRRHAAMLGSALAACLGAMPWFLYAKFWARVGEQSEKFLNWMDPVSAASSLALPGRLAGIDTLSRQAGAVLPVIVSLVVVALCTAGLLRIPVPRTGPEAVGVRCTLATIWLLPPLGALAAGLVGWGDLLVVPRYFALTAMVQLILVASAVGAIPGRLRAAAGAAVLAVLAALSGLVLVDAGRDELRSAARIVNAERSRWELVVVFGAHGDTRVFEHAVEGPVIRKVVERRLNRGQEPTRAGVGLRLGSRGVWVLTPTDHGGLWTKSPKRPVDVTRYLVALRDRYGSMESHDFGEQRLLHFSNPVRKPPAKKQKAETRGELR